ncbi:MAG: DUF3137 domain-containing protein [Alphaproteobacteria bacterium]|nr:DUF3137 domain-containing protein [Alphaproteobacteria bacterium]
MSKEQKTDESPQEEHVELGELNRVDDTRFNKTLEALIQESEDTRLHRMKQMRTRGFIAMNASIALIFIGIAAFGWFFLMEGKIIEGLIAIALSLAPSVLLYKWADLPLKKYVREHKEIFMPKLAKAINGLSFYPKRGVSSKILGKLAVLPAHDRYEAEDCFMGMYKGVKVIFSEARLYSKTYKTGQVFDGIFVLLETPADVIDGHTIVTANNKMVKAYSKTRWKTMQQVHIAPSDPKWDKFTIYSTKPDSAELIIGDRLLKELAEASEIFDNAPLTAVFFGNKYIFIMLPYDKDMFEASDIHVPVTTKQHATQCKKEIEQILEIVDVFDLYQPVKS